MEKANLLEYQEYSQGEADFIQPLGNAPLRDFGPEKPKRGYASFFKFDFYEKFFDIESDDVLHRLKYALLPTTKSTQLENIKTNPDLYGPLWVCITLIVSLSIFENIGKFIKYYGQHQDGWYSDFGKMSSAALTIFIYSWIIPSLLFVYLKFKDNLTSLKYTELICLYGYSLTVFIPSTFACMIDKNWLQWIILLAAGILSFLVVAESLWITFLENKKTFKVLILATIFVVDFVFVFVLKHFFIN